MYKILYIPTAQYILSPDNQERIFYSEEEAKALITNFVKLSKRKSSDNVYKLVIKKQYYEIVEVKE